MKKKRNPKPKRAVEEVFPTVIVRVLDDIVRENDGEKPKRRLPNPYPPPKRKK
jgi:hypothetical protein